MTVDANKEAYMLRRDHGESRRLNVQHDFMRALCNDQLLHPSIPGENLQAVADVGAGTAVWLQDVAHNLLASSKATRDTEFVGFDISDQQFPVDRMPGMKLLVHNMTESFPLQYHGKFDIVHVRLLSYAIPAIDLMKTVENVVEILRQ